MTGVIHHGVPGSYKSFSVVQRVMVKALLEGRTVYTNIRGFNSFEQIEDALDIEIPLQAKLIHVDTTNQQGRDTLGCFFHYAKEGALVVIDEAQKIYPRRLRNLSIFDNENPEGERPATLEQAFDEHRHHNWDIYLCTTHIAKIHSEIRQVVEVAYRHTSLGNIVPWWKNKWKEQPHDAESNGKSQSSWTGTYKKYTADLRYFDCYQSTATGKAQVSAEDRNIFKDPKLQFLGCILAFTFLYGFYNFAKYKNVHGETDANQSALEESILFLDEDSHLRVNNANSDVFVQANNADNVSLEIAEIEFLEKMKAQRYEHPWRIVADVGWQENSSQAGLVIISNGDVTRRISMDDCEYIQFELNCYLNDKVVTRWTGVREIESFDGLSI